MVLDIFFPVENKRTLDCSLHPERVHGHKWQQEGSWELGTYHAPGMFTVCFSFNPLQL